MAILNLESAIFWGQLSSCHHFEWDEPSHYSCDDKAAYSAVAAFTSLIMIFQTIFVLCMCKLKWYHEYVVDSSGNVADLNNDVDGDTTIMLNNKV